MDVAGEFSQYHTLHDLRILVDRYRFPREKKMINFIIWIFAGAVIGWVASLIMKTNSRQGLIADRVVGLKLSVLRERSSPSICAVTFAALCCTSPFLRR